MAWRHSGSNWRTTACTPWPLWPALAWTLTRRSWRLSDDAFNDSQPHDPDRRDDPRVDHLLDSAHHTVRERNSQGVMVEVPRKRIPIKYGLDLQGGMHLALGLDTSLTKVDNSANAMDLRAHGVAQAHR